MNPLLYNLQLQDHMKKCYFDNIEISEIAHLELLDSTHQFLCHP